jgi:hypothetical protein
MSLSISSATAQSSTNAAFSPSKVVDRKAVHNLRSDLNSGDTAGAQQAFSTLTRNVPSAIVSDPGTSLGQLNEALQSGDSTAAKVALGDFAKNVHTYREAKAAPVAAPAGTLLNAAA